MLPQFSAGDASVPLNDLGAIRAGVEAFSDNRNLMKMRGKELDKKGSREICN